MKIHTKRLLLVPLGPQYLISTHAYASDIENTTMMMHLPNTDLNETKSFLEGVQAEWQKKRPSFYEFAILLDQEHIGAVSLYIDEDHAEGELGWIIRKEYWGNGYATEAASEIMKFAIQELHIRIMIAHCDSENSNSSRVMEKLGMSFVSRTGGRKNRASDEEREELMYSFEVK